MPIAKHHEDTLDRRLRKVHENNNDFQPVMYRQGTEDTIVASGQNGLNSSYAYTQMKNVSPIRSRVHGQNNVPMTY